MLARGKETTPGGGRAEKNVWVVLGEFNDAQGESSHGILTACGGEGGRKKQEQKKKKKECRRRTWGECRRQV